MIRIVQENGIAHLKIMCDVCREEITDNGIAAFDWNQSIDGAVQFICHDDEVCQPLIPEFYGTVEFQIEKEI